MASRNRFAQTYLFSTIGVIAMAILLVVVNFIAGVIGGRADLSQENLHTLSPGTRAIVDDLESPVTIRYYFSEKAAGEARLGLQTYARRVEDLLKEYKRIGGDKVIVRKYDPEPLSDAADSADLDGILAQDVGRGETLYFGLSVNQLDEQQAIPFLHPSRENLLEYDLTRAIYRVSHPEKDVVGVMSSLPVMGSVPMPMQMPGMPQNQEEPWRIITELKKEYNVRKVDSTADSIDAEIDVLVLIHPQELPEKTLFAIDQFVLQGGRVLAFVDPMSTAESRSRSPMQAARSQAPGASTLGPLFDAWGIVFDTENIVADLVYPTRIRHPRTGEPVSMPAILSLTDDAMSDDNPMTTQLESVILAFAGVFTGEVAEGLESEILLHTSARSDMVEKFRAQMAPDSIHQEIVESGEQYALAMRLSGTFRTAFPGGKPGSGNAGGNDEGPPSAQEDKETETEAADQWLKESAGDAVVIVVGDTDIIFDDFCVQTQRIFGQTVAYPISDNLSLAQNMVDQLAGGSLLMQIRSRVAINRPFKVINAKEAEARKEFQGKIDQLENELQEVQMKLNELQRGRDEQGDQKVFMSGEQLQALENFRLKQVEARKELKQLQKQLRRDINSLENTLKWANIAVMPLLVGLGGIVLAIIKRRREVKK